jgi:hypothetical protein
MRGEERIWEERKGEKGIQYIGWKVRRNDTNRLTKM